VNTSNLRRYAGDGTAAMITGTLVAGIGNYAYQLLGGRVLGPHLFAPIGSLLTIHFLAFIIVLLPVEQLVIRSTTLHGGMTKSTVLTGRVAVVATALLAFAVGFIGKDRFFGGDVRFAYLAGLTVLTHALFVHGRGSLAGTRRFRSYGESGGGAAIVRVFLAAIILLIGRNAIEFAAALAVGPLIILAWPSALRVRTIPHQRTDPVRFLGTFILAAATSQVLLLTGPLVAGVLGATAATISTVFVTFTLARAPLTFGYNLIARALPPFTALAQRGEDALLTRWVMRLLGLGVVFSVPAGFLGYWLGPPIVGVLFGEGFRPDPAFASLAAAGITLAGASLFLGQVLVARGDTGRLAVAWIAGLVTAVAGLLLTRGGADLRIGVAFLTGETSAIIALAVAAARMEQGWVYTATKRTLDLVVAGFFGLLLSPLFAALALAVKLDSRGPALFRQERIGLDGERFGMLKFRTMRHDAGETLHIAHLEQLQPDAPRLKIRDDPRITRVGRFLRKGSLDELPNLWNVIKGDMSLVGPRPLVPAESEALGDPIRQSVKPGITGLAQIRGRDAISPEERNTQDGEYVRTRSFLLDLRILAVTIPTIFRDPGE
jgi:lipopolysaccharide/colanic/teichoic acid biosynthesis glycosyltransferase